MRAELVLGHGLQVSNKLVAELIIQEQLKGLPNRRTRKNLVAVAAAADLVSRDFHREAPDQLRTTDISEHPTREGELCCCVVLDAHSRKVIGGTIDSTQTAALVTNAPGMTIANRTPDYEAVLHSDHGSQFTSCMFAERVREAGLAPSMGTVGDAHDNAVVESFWAHLLTELLDRKKWKTRVELASAVFEYLGIFHDRTRRQGSLGMLTPIEYGKLHAEVARVA